MQRIRAAVRPRRPWKNGGGVTTEIAIAPAGAGFDDFDWRISTATVGVAGPFSRFDGVDRSLAILQGDGLKLAIDGAAPFDLTPASTPCVFTGEQAAHAALVGGAVTDFNVMTRRARWRHTLRALEVGGEPVLVPGADVVLAYCAGAPIGAGLRCEDEQGEQLELAPGDAALATAAAGVTLSSLGGPVKVLLVRLYEQAMEL